MVKIWWRITRKTFFLKEETYSISLVIMSSIKFGISTNIWKLVEDVAALTKLSVVSFAWFLTNWTLELT